MDVSLAGISSLLSTNLNKDELFAKARQARFEHFGNEVFAYGFNYFSTYCSNHCSFCYYQSDNAHTIRYRNSTEQVVEDARRLADSGVHLIDLTMGEDPYYQQHIERLADLIQSVKSATGLPVMISPGVLEAWQLRLLKEAGATWLALYQETFDKAAFERLRICQSFEARLRVKEEAIKAGLLVEEGLLTGWGDSCEDAAASILAINSTHPTQVRAMSFVPQPGTPLESWPAADSERELLIIALLRLLYPHKLIPASLDVEGPKGLEDRLNAGANVITSLIPPQSGLVGVASRDDIKDGGRSLPQIQTILDNAGLKLASSAGYQAYIQAALDEHVRFGRADTETSPTDFCAREHAKVW
ncbi:MAG: methylornithine synthase PylB [Coriobacteriia bacterium]|nr:methylornithine synthase PylB [Coriobacteriia bacterium]MCL2751067.1 methylornithine synthase PylB [Coriobacteriia bacterium]